jgi:hypothetical protein
MSTKAFWIAVSIMIIVSLSSIILNTVYFLNEHNKKIEVKIVGHSERDSIINVYRLKTFEAKRIYDSVKIVNPCDLKERREKLDKWQNDFEKWEYFVNYNKELK